MILNKSSLEDLQKGFSTAYQGGFAGVQPLRERIATTVRSTTALNKYSWLGEFPGMREWIGPRVIHNISNKTYEITNRTWEETVAVKRDDIEDDQIGIYTPIFQEFGRAVADHPDQLIFDQLVGGFSANCYDGQYFFDSDHPVLNPATGVEASVSNVQTGSGDPWFLLDTTRALKPLIFQERRKANFVSKQSLDDENVFLRNEFIYGADGRWAAGYGFWQMAFGSKATFNADNLRTAYTAMTNFKGDGGRPLGIKPTVLVVGNSNHFAARDVLMASQINGTTNTNQNLVEILHVPRLA
ncbi:Mu-like prophage major head subunit gpT family protein [Prosthecomicrobium hirschii]|uniref:Mu-like prophage major head subunit gpT family protein n=2 Tax=Prosthecodimorpha hirschii TaxID=665126 RepID=UPI00221FADBE|nr:Mu-like prophage major head subunit gpT family protein [Prosthecomicrobium hirschii]MCW1842294.1 Mu-like prophage major head subunit gpT family protein [Prosthecomicrobium hirschii]